MKNYDEILAEFLGIELEQVTIWSDNSLTIRSVDSLTINGDMDCEYIVLESTRDGFMEYLGTHDGYHIYKN